MNQFQIICYLNSTEFEKSSLGGSIKVSEQKRDRKLSIIKIQINNILNYRQELKLTLADINLFWS